MEQHNIHLQSRLNLSLALGSKLLLSVRLQQGAVTENPLGEGRRAQRALRSQAMAELAVAWSNSTWRTTGRGG
ncbi:MAG: hypothetical protein WEK74_12975 [Hydrogenophaga sp.]